MLIYVMPNIVKTSVNGLLLATLVIALSNDLIAAPVVRSMTVRGLQIGGTTTVRIDGTDLLPNPRLLMSVPIAKQSLKPNSTATRLEFDVTLTADIAPGLYNFWLVNDSGASTAAIVAVDRLSNIPFSTEVPSLPVSMHGVVTSSAKLRTTFAATKGQPLLIEVESQRLGGQLRPVLHLFDSENQHLDWSLPSTVLRGDTRLKFTAPADGKYTVELHDLQYAAPAPNHFRLKIGVWEYVDLVFPPAVERAKAVEVDPVGNVPAGQKLELVRNNSSDATVVLAQDSPVAAFRPPVLLSDLPEVIEAAPQTEPQQLPVVPFGISGRLLAAGEQDRYRLTVNPGTKLRFELFADRLGSPMDAVLQILNEQGGQLAINDDTTGTSDPALEYVIPAKTESVFLAVKEANGIGSPNNIYRVEVTEANPASEKQDFRLSVIQQEQSVMAGERLIVKVVAKRDGYTGSIRLGFDSLPDGVQVQGSVIADNADSTLMTLHGTGQTVEHALTSLHGTAVIDGQEVVRAVTSSTHPVGDMQPWLSREMAVALVESSDVDFDFDWGRIDQSTQLALGGKLDAPLEYFRPAGFDGPIRITLEASQQPIVVNGRVDTNRTIRSETNRPVEMPVDANAQSTWNAKLAADKVLSDARTNQTAVLKTTARLTVDAEAKLKMSTAQLAAAMVAAKAAEAQAKSTKAAAAAAAAALAKVIARVESTATAANGASTDNVTSSAEAIAAAATELQTAATAKAAADKAAADAAAKFKAATSDVASAQLATSKADAAVKTAIAAQAKAKADTDKAVADGVAKQAAAVAAANDAARLAKNVGTFSIFVPADLKQPGYDVAFKSELLSRDKKTVLATRYSEVRRISTLNPIVVQPSTPQGLTAVIDPRDGATVTITGKVNRLAGMKQDVTVSLIGLPTGVAVPRVVVKADETDYKLDVRFPATFKPASLTDVRLFATGKMRSNAPIPVRSEEVPVAIQLTAPTDAKPAPTVKK